jgi:hypothetical protein
MDLYPKDDQDPAEQDWGNAEKAALSNARPALRAKQPNATHNDFAKRTATTTRTLKAIRKPLPVVSGSGTGIGRRNDAQKPTVFVL